MKTMLSMYGLDLDSMKVVRQLPELETVDVPTVHQGIGVYAGRRMNRRQRRAIAGENRRKERADGAK